jgi:hypothetical protein
MPYHITKIRHELFPDAVTSERAFLNLGLSSSDVLRVFERYTCPTALTPGRGYQMDIAHDLEAYLEQELRRDGLRPSRWRYELTYSSKLNQHADFGLIHLSSNRRILFEIEFRPNYEKDLIKFQIGYNSGVLAAAVMVVAIDRKSLNPSYTSMPEYDSIVKVLNELKPQYNLLVVGLRGSHTI